MIRLFKYLAVATTLILIYRAFREPEEPDVRPQRIQGGGATSHTEPVLGYDGMDVQTLLPWLESANLDRATLRRIREYEQRHQARENVLEIVDDLLV